MRTIDYVARHIEENGFGNVSLNPWQLLALSEALKPGSLVVTKDRQAGFSTLMRGLVAWHMSVNNDVVYVSRNRVVSNMCRSLVAQNNALVDATLRGNVLTLPGLGSLWLLDMSAIRLQPVPRSASLIVIDEAPQYDVSVRDLMLSCNELRDDRGTIITTPSDCSEQNVEKFCSIIAASRRMHMIKPWSIV